MIALGLCGLISAKPGADLDQAVLSAVKQATVFIGNCESGNLRSVGSGVLLADGVSVMTASHVVTGSDNVPDICKVVFRPGTGSEEVLTINPEQVFASGVSRQDVDYTRNDFAVIRLPKTIPGGLAVSEGAEFYETQTLWSVGFPRAGSESAAKGEFPIPTIHSLIIERVDKLGTRPVLWSLKGTATHGDSGGPVIDRFGNLIALIAARYDQDGTILAVPAWKREYVAEAILSKKSAREEFFSSPASPTETREPKGSSQQPIRREKAFLAEFPWDRDFCDKLTVEQLRLTVNDLYAWHGYIFKTKELNATFKLEKWYKPKTSSMSKVEKSFSKLERENLSFVLKEIKRRS